MNRNIEELTRDRKSLKIQLKAYTSPLGFVTSSPIEREQIERDLGKVETLIQYQELGFTPGKLSLVPKA